MLHRLSRVVRIVALCAFWYPADAFAITTVGSVDASSSLGQFLSLAMTIDDTTTTFELTGPDYCYFAFGFDTITMFGYSLIVEGTDGNRTVVEQNLQGIGNPGAPQATQNITVLDTFHDAANDLTTITIMRPNHTGDPNDPDFTTSMAALDVIWAYNSTASPSFPNPVLSYHGLEGRGLATINFTPIPEPNSALLAAVGAAAMWSIVLFRRRSLNCPAVKPALAVSRTSAAAAR